MNRIHPNTQNCCKRRGIASRGKKISNIKRPWETNFSPKFRRTREETAEQTASRGDSFLTCARRRALKAPQRTAQTIL